MDTGEGRFEMLTNLEDLFTVGEELEVRGLRFRIKSINPFGIKLKLYKDKEEKSRE